MTAHINAQKGDFAKTVLMPGDPLRAKFIAENYLDNAKLVTSVRNVLGYTGSYKGKEVSVMASGMGMPSMGIYSYELYNFFDVENIIRIGSAGAIDDGLNVMDIVIGMAACTDSNYINSADVPGMYAPCASYKLLSQSVLCAKEKGLEVKVGNMLSSDVFYSPLDNLKKWQEMSVLAVEMEAAALYFNAAKARKNALCICTISDSPLKGTEISSSDREKGLTNMIELALETARALE